MAVEGWRAFWARPWAFYVLRTVLPNVPLEASTARDRWRAHLQGNLNPERKHLDHRLSFPSRVPIGGLESLGLIVLAANQDRILHGCLGPEPVHAIIRKLFALRPLPLVYLIRK